MDNYEIARDRAQRYFLGFDQERIIREWNLKHDEKYLYVEFLGRPYGVSRKTGQVLRLWDGKEAGHNEVLSIFDLLCHQDGPKILTGKFAPVNSLNGKPRAAGVGTDFHSGIAKRFASRPEAFVSACEKLGGERVKMGDIGFCFPVFGELRVILKFYHADEDFPASLTLLWDDNALQFMFYETVFYIAGFLMNVILEEMVKITE